MTWPASPSAITRTRQLPECQVRNSGKFKLLAELLPSLKKDGHRPLLFSQWTSVRTKADPYALNVASLESLLTTALQVHASDHQGRAADVICLIVLSLILPPFSCWTSWSGSCKTCGYRTCG